MFAILESADFSWLYIAKIILRTIVILSAAALATYLHYRRRMNWSMRHDLLEKSKVQTLFGSPWDGNRLK